MRPRLLTDAEKQLHKIVDDAVELADMGVVTAAQVAAHVAMLRKRFEAKPTIKLMEAVLDLMRKYTPKKRSITWGEVKRLEFKAREQG